MKDSKILWKEKQAGVEKVTEEPDEGTFKCLNNKWTNVLEHGSKAARAQSELAGRR